MRHDNNEYIGRLPKMPQDRTKRYATAAIVLGGGAILGTSFLSSAYSNSQQNHGRPISYNGQQYYIPGDSKRVRYPSKEACLQDVPWDMQAQCEPVDDYHGGHGGHWYGPVYSTGSTSNYRPNPKYPTEDATSSNTGKKLPSAANTSGFGSNGKALTGSKGG